MKNLILSVLCLVAIAAVGCCSKCCGGDAMDKPREGWHNIPGHGTIYFKPGDVYEHNTRMMRDASGARRAPTTPETVRRAKEQAAQRAAHCPHCAYLSYAQQAACPYCVPSPYAPHPYHHPTPYYQPQHPAPVFPYPAPVYQPYQPAPYPYGPQPQPTYAPYGPAPQPNRYSPDYGPYRRPSSNGWGLGQYGENVDPMDVPKTGDAPLAE